MITHLKENKKNLHIFLILLFLFLLFQTIPYLYGFYLAKNSFYFTTFFTYRTDLVTYIGKINQGIQGNWLFSFDYTHQPTQGYFIYTYYLFLGHLANLFHFTAMQIFHIARISASILLFISLYRFTYYSLKKYPSTIFYTIFITSLIGRGPSFFIEPHPLFASQFSAHLPLAFAIILFLLTPHHNQNRKWQFHLVDFLLSFILSLISSFSVTVIISILSISFIFNHIFNQEKKETFLRLIAIGNGGGWIVLFQFYITHTQPELIAWNIQNILVQLPIHIVILSFFPLIILAYAYIIKVLIIDKTFEKTLTYPIAWLILTPFFMIIPFTLRSRLYIGIYPAIATLGILMIFYWLKKINYKILSFILIVFTLIDAIFNTYFLINEMNLDIKDPSPFIFVPIDAYQSLSWINQNLPEDSLILASYNNGNLIPAFTSSRAVAGHWCETPNAQENKEFVLDYYQGNLTENDLKKVEVDYVFFSEIEDAIGPGFIEEDWIQVYQNENVRIYQVIY